MVKQRKRIGMLLALAVVALAAEVQALDSEFYVNTYRSIGTVSPHGTRSVAMGGAGRGMADGAASLGVNPAALGAFSGKEVDVGIGYDWLADGADKADQVTFRLGGAVNLECLKPSSGPNQAIGGLLDLKGYSGAAGVDMKRNQTGVLMAYGLHLMENLLGGVSVALFDGEWKSGPITDNAVLYLDRSFTGGDFKLGGLYRVSDETTFGATLGYAVGAFRDKATYASAAGTGLLNRVSVGMGVAHQLRPETLILGDLWFDWMKTDLPGVINEQNRSWGLSVGIEQQVIPETMALRGGLYYDHNSYSSGGPATFVSGSGYTKGRFGMTAGVGVKLYALDLGYSLDVGTGGTVKNLLDVSVKW